MALAAEAKGGTQRGLVASALAWSTGATAITQVLAFVRSLILARLLNPEAYGLIGMANVVLQGLTIFTEFQLANFLFTVSAKGGDPDRKYVDTIWTADLIRRAAVAVMLLVASYPAAIYFGDERVFPILLVISLVPLITGFTNAGMTLYKRDLRLRFVVFHQQGAEILTTVVTIAIAYFTRDVWALVVGQVVAAVLGVVLSYVISPYRPRFALDRAVLRQCFGFGKHMLVIGVLTYITTQFDNMAVGRWLGTAALGFYVMAYRLAMLPVDVLGAICAHVLVPLYARIKREEPQRLGTVFVLVVNGATTLLLLILGPLAIVAHDAVHLLYGNKWTPAAPVVQVLVAAALFRGVARVAGPLFVGMNKPELDARAKMIEAAIFIPAVLTLVPSMGANGAAIAGGLSYFVGAVVRVGIAVRLLSAVESNIFDALLRPVLVAVIPCGFATAIYLTGFPAFMTALAFAVTFAGLSFYANAPLRDAVFAMVSGSMRAGSRARALSNTGD